MQEAVTPPPVIIDPDAFPMGSTDAAGRILLHVRCASCGYDLQALDAHGVCAECGAPVSASVAPGFLSCMRPAYVRIVVVGLRMLLLGWIIGAAAVCVNIIPLLVQWTDYDIYFAILTGLQIGLTLEFTVGVWLTTWQLGSLERTGAVIARWGARFCTPLAGALIVAEYTIFLQFMNGRFPISIELLQVVGVAARIVGAAGAGCLFWYLRDVARRVPNDRLRYWATVSFAILLAFDAINVLTMIVQSWWQTGLRVYAIWIAMFALGIVSLGISMWITIALLRAVRAALTRADHNWSLLTRSG